MRSVALAVLMAACGGGGGMPGDGAPPDVVLDPGGDPTGGWTRPGPLHACFDDSGYAAFGDTPEEVLTPSTYVTWTSQGMLYFQTGGGTGQWRILDDELVVWIEEPCTGNCGPFRYQRDASLTCFNF